MVSTPSRRHVMIGLSATPLIAAPIGGAGRDRVSTPFRLAEARYTAASARFNNLPASSEQDEGRYELEVDAYLLAWRAVEAAPVADWSEFVRQFEIACDGGESQPNESTLRKLMIDARRLVQARGFGPQPAPQ